MLFGVGCVLYFLYFPHTLRVCGGGKYRKYKNLYNLYFPFGMYRNYRK